MNTPAVTGSDPAPTWPSAERPRIACIGECMVEIMESADGGLSYTYAGDVFNTAVYLVRELDDAPHQVEFVTAAGDDPFSDGMLAFFEQQGVGCELVVRLPGQLPGLYWLRTDAGGERHFYYWRSGSAASRLMRGGRHRVLARWLAGFDLVYLSGISLAINRPRDRRRLLKLLRRLRWRGARVVYDSNYRQTLWRSAADAREWLAELASLADVALVSFADESAMAGDAHPEDTVRRLHRLGPSEVVVSNGVEPCLVSSAEGIEEFPVTPAEQVDTTAAGDSFNAGYIGARLAGAGVGDAVRRAQTLSAQVVGHRGAILP